MNVMKTVSLSLIVLVMTKNFGFYISHFFSTFSFIRESKKQLERLTGSYFHDSGLLNGKIL